MCITDIMITHWWTLPRYKNEHEHEHDREELFKPTKRNLKNVSHQTPMVHAETAPGRSFGRFQQQYPLPASWRLQLFWLMQQRPAESNPDTSNLEIGSNWRFPIIEQNFSDNYRKKWVLQQFNLFNLFNQAISSLFWTENVFYNLTLKWSLTVLFMADDCPWRKAKIPPYQPLYGAIIANYGGKPRNNGWYTATNIRLSASMADIQ